MNSKRWCLCLFLSRLSGVCSKYVLIASHPQERNDVVFSDGLQQARSSGQRLEAGTTGGEKRANHNHPRRGPRERADHQVSFHRVSKPEQWSEEETFRNMTRTSAFTMLFQRDGRRDELVSKNDALHTGSKQQHTAQV